MTGLRPGPSITPQQALVDYLALGGERSLRRLVQHYDEIGMRNSPSFATVALWSSRFGWDRKAREHDDFVGAALLSRLRDEAVRREFDRVAALMKVAQRCLEVAATVDIDESSATVADIKALTTTAIDAIKMVEVLTGGVSDRTESARGIATEAKELLQKLEQQKRGVIASQAPHPSEEYTGGSAPIARATEKASAARTDESWARPADTLRTTR
jgi:hypothetical protein